MRARPGQKPWYSRENAEKFFSRQKPRGCDLPENGALFVRGTRACELDVQIARA